MKVILVQRENPMCNCKECDPSFMETDVPLTDEMLKSISESIPKAASEFAPKPEFDWQDKLLETVVHQIKNAKHWEARFILKSWLASEYDAGTCSEDGDNPWR